VSTELGRIPSIPSSDPVSPDISVTRFWGGPHGSCKQLTIDDKFVQLDQQGIDRLVLALCDVADATALGE
jgi:hypothetical protein